MIPATSLRILDSVLPSDALCGLSRTFPPSTQVPRSADRSITFLIWISISHDHSLLAESWLWNTPLAFLTSTDVRSLRNFFPGVVSPVATHPHSSRSHTFAEAVAIPIAVLDAVVQPLLVRL